MRASVLFAAGLLTGVGIPLDRGQDRDVVALNHFAIAVDDYAETVAFFRDTMGFPEALAFRDDNGEPVFTYVQVSRSTFIEIVPVRPDRPAGFVHAGLEVKDVAATLDRMADHGLDPWGPVTSAWTGSRLAGFTTPQGIVVELLEFGPQSLQRRAMEAWR